MAAIVRLKRHLDDEPMSALILNCKKRKKNNENDSESEVSTILTFAGTVNNQEDDLSPHISKLSKDDIENSFKKRIPNITNKIRQQTKEASEENRFKIVNLFRSAKKDNPQQNSVLEAQNKLPITVLDVETTDKINEKNEACDSNYVYDLYYTDSEGINNTELDVEFQICPANEMIFDDGTLPDSDHDTDDSNDENNWRNDYPDEEDDDSIDEDDMRKAIDRLSLGDNSDDDDSSIDKRPDGFMYSIDSEAVGFEEDVDCADGRRYGELYARFKMRQKREEENYNKDLYHDEIDDTDDDYYD